MLEMRKGAIEKRMTPLQIIVVTCLYIVALLIVIYFTRATVRRIVGAFAGGAAVGLFGMGTIFFGNAFGLWRVPIVWTPFFLTLFYLGLTITVTPIYLVTWRVARRFGWRGMAGCLGAVAIIGPPRDYLYAMKFPEWMVFAPGHSTYHRRRPDLYWYRGHRTCGDVSRRRTLARGPVAQQILIVSGH